MIGASGMVWGHPVKALGVVHIDAWYQPNRYSIYLPFIKTVMQLIKAWLIG